MRMAHEIFIFIIKQNPHSRKMYDLQRGDATSPENNRPICGLPQFYKLFSMMLYNRLYAVLDRFHCAAQARFRKSQTTDHLVTYKLITQKTRKWETDMWVTATTDLKKALDSIQHEAIWRSLRNHLISEQYISLLKIVHWSTRHRTG